MIGKYSNEMKKNMKVLLINTVCGIRSTGRICSDISDVLNEQGIECRIAYGRGNVPEAYKTIGKKIGSEIDVKIHALGARIFDNAGFGSKRATAEFLRWVKEWNPDIIHLHNIHGYYIDVKQLFEFLKRFNKPVIWTLHDCWPFTGHCVYFDYVHCNKWMNGCKSCPQKKRYPSSLVFDRSARNYRLKKELFSGVGNMTIVTPSNWLANLIKDSYLNKYQVQVIPNGIDLKCFSYSESSVRKKYGVDDKTVILAVADGWSEPRKGLADIIELSKDLNDQERIILVGYAGNEKHDLPPNIIPIGKTNNVRELVELYSTADVFINTTHEDNYPTVNLEAQACGTPVVTYRTGGSVESVPDDNVVEVGNVREFLHKIRSHKNLSLIEKNLLDKTRSYSQYLNLYLETLK